MVLFCGERIWNLAEFSIVCETEGSNTDSVDFLVYRISEQNLKYFSATCSFFHLKDIVAHSHNTDSFTIIVGGFPCNSNRSCIDTSDPEVTSVPKSQAFSLKCFEPSHRSFRHDGFDFQRHIAFRYPKRFPDRNGGTSLSVTPNGMSGGPVIAPSGDPEHFEWSLTAIISDRHSDGYLVATTLEQVFGTIHHDDSEQYAPCKNDARVCDSWAAPLR